jgi:glycosyltransferase involved in cell wall biosynthesis
MKVLHIVAGDLKRGAARGAFWLHQGLIDAGVDSKILTNSKLPVADKNIITTSSGRKAMMKDIFRQRMDSLPLKIYKNRQKFIFSPGIAGFNFLDTDVYKESDIIHLHWICNGFVNVKHLSKIDKPTVWTMRDMWPFTGGCHYAMECKHYETGCGYCPQLNSRKKYDLSRFILRRKSKYIPKNVKMVGISQWLSNCAKSSLLLRNFDIRTIYNNIDTQEFFSINKKIARDILGLKTQKKILLTAAQNLSDTYKGFDKFLESIKFLDRKRYYLLFFGNLEEELISNTGFEFKTLGFIDSNIVLRIIYSAADVFVATSIMEAFGKTLAESMACGTPVVCFDITGPKDICDHKVNGYKAKPFDSQDISAGIEWAVNSSNYKEVCENAREKVIKEFDSRVIAEKYIKLYEGL